MTRSSLAAALVSGLLLLPSLAGAQSVMSKAMRTSDAQEPALAGC